ncbi:MAG: universal stress protein [Desulfobacterales bacterium]
MRINQARQGARPRGFQGRPLPLQGLIQTAEDEGPDLMVMGKKGRSDIADVLFGSNAEKVLGRYPIPLFSVRSIKN